jgi:hypothetical protein
MNLSAIRIMIAFIINRKRPIVSMVTGNVNNISNGFTIAFKAANANAKMMAVLNPSI